MNLSLSEILRRMSHRLEGVYGVLAKAHREAKLAEEYADDAKKLAHFGFSAYSIADEDGIQSEIFRRIGTTNRQFIEIGCGDGLQNNTVYLLLSGWAGLWIDACPENIASVRRHLGGYLASDKLAVRRALVAKNNINALIREAGLNKEPDLLVIDIDGNDYHVWESLDCIRPRAVCIEYNATFRPPIKVVQPYKANWVWDGSNFGGASLKALEALGQKKRYALVGCCSAGSNAYFIREDLVGDQFSAPYTAENHFREAFYDSHVRGLTQHRRGVLGSYTILP